MSTFKFFANNYNLGEQFLFICSVLLYLLNGISRGLWGFLYDKFHFKTLVTILCSINLIVSVTFYFIIQIPALFCIYLMIAGFIAGAPFSIISLSVFNKYGPKLGTEVYGIIYIAFGAANLTAPTISKAISLSSYSSTLPYLFLYMASVPMILASYFCLRFLDLTRIESLDENKEEIGSVGAEKIKD